MSFHTVKSSLFILVPTISYFHYGMEMVFKQIEW